MPRPSGAKRFSSWCLTIMQSSSEVHHRLREDILLLIVIPIVYYKNFNTMVVSWMKRQKNSSDELIDKVMKADDETATELKSQLV